ncbi:hypothetical protein D3C80_1989320 [compost metagenome]
MHYAAYLALAAIAQDHQLPEMNGAVCRQQVIRVDNLLRMLRKRNVIGVHHVLLVQADASLEP